MVRRVRGQRDARTDTDCDGKLPGGHPLNEFAQRPSPALSERELALRSGQVLDLPRRQARLLALGGACAVVPIVVASLTGGTTATLGVDKILHCAGYAALAAILVLGLRGRRMVAALIGVVALGIAIEWLQPLNGRAFEIADGLADTLGVLLGAGIGLGARLAHGVLRTELETARVRRTLRQFPPGATIVPEGARLDAFFVVKSGTVALLRHRDGRRIEIARAGPGEMFGLLAETLRIAQPLAAVALTPVQIYAPDYDQIIDAVGGREQPLGVIVEGLAAKLREAWAENAALRERPSPPPTSIATAAASASRRGTPDPRAGVIATADRPATMARQPGD